MQPYQYKPLPNRSSIRILILHPAADTSSMLECDIITNDRLTTLRGPDNKTFDAVSYVWGNGTHDIPMYCKSEGTYLYISAVVSEMLRSLRKGHKERRQWVDALCLNQKDNQEKSIQVQQMGQIYHMADKVHIWLGPAEATAPLAFAFLRTLVAKFEPTPDRARNPTTEEILDTFEEVFQHRDFQQVLGLLQKSWFTRRWTLQEGFLARDAIVRCGGSKVSWHWFTEGLKFIQKRSQELRVIESDHSASYALNVLKTLQSPADLLSMLWTLHMSECSDPRDRIYSLLGLAQNMGRVAHDAKTGSSSNRELPIPDYTLCADSVYRGFAEHCTFTDRFLQVLLHIDAFGRLSEVNPNWPSWVPNWTRARERKRNSPRATSDTMPRIRYIDNSLFFSNDQGESLSHEVAFRRDAQFLFPQPTKYSNGIRHGLVIYGRSFQNIIGICNPWPRSDNSNHVVEYLTDWIHQETILHLPHGELNVLMMEKEIRDCLLFLITGTDFLGYAKYMLLHDAEGTKYRDPWVRRGFQSINHIPSLVKCQRIANLVYPIAQKPCFYTFDQVHSREHLDVNYDSNPPPNVESRQELSDFLDEVSRMMREGRKQLITASCSDTSETLKRRRHWIAPNDIKMGDIITDITWCGRIGALLRPIDSPLGLRGRPVFQFIGILWSLENIERPDCSQLEKFLIL